MCALALTAAPVVQADGVSEGVTIETSVGPVTCVPSAESTPGPEAITATPFARGTRIAIRETGALRCATATFGEVEMTAAGLPWRLTLNEKQLTARLRGSPRPGLLLQSVALPSLRCLYEAGKVLGTVTAGTPPSVSLSVNRVRLEKPLSSGLCPALGPVGLQLTL